MKFALGLFFVLWVFCGLAAVWMRDYSPTQNWKIVARGPMALVEAIKEEPVNIPTGQ